MTDYMRTAPGITESRSPSPDGDSTNDATSTRQNRVAKPTPRREANPFTLQAIAQWWWENDREGFAWDYYGPGEPSCFRCGWLAPVRDYCDDDKSVWKCWERAAGWLERAHLEDHWALRRDGRVSEDGPWNQVPLCHWCHRDDMPEFHDEDARGQALAWVRSRPRKDQQRQAMTDAIWFAGSLPTGGGKAAKLAKAVDRSQRKVNNTRTVNYDGSPRAKEDIYIDMGLAPDHLAPWERPGFIPYVGAPEVPDPLSAEEFEYEVELANEEFLDGHHDVQRLVSDLTDLHTRRAFGVDTEYGLAFQMILRTGHLPLVPLEELSRDEVIAMAAGLGAAS